MYKIYHIPLAIRLKQVGILSLREVLVAKKILQYRMGDSIRGIVVFLLLLCIPFSIYSQSDNSSNKMSWSLYAIKAFELSDDEETKGIWSSFGAGVEASYHWDSAIGISGNLSYRKWPNTGYLPFTIGPAYQLSFSPGTKLSMQLTVGPAGILGIDYAGVFASCQFGLRLRQMILQSQSLFFGANIGQGMSFHPDHFEYWEILVGFTF